MNYETSHTNDKMLCTAEDALNMLKKRYPERCPRIGESKRAIWMNAGACEAIRLLQYRLDQQKGEGVFADVYR
ncbi:MAG: hypothetical protein [Bacteriophage sp.]|nr:MAG: hypothetical protein [Bacteriophage sp.]